VAGADDAAVGTIITDMLGVPGHLSVQGVLVALK
jgi:hypothetical protein